MATKTLGKGILLKYDENNDSASHTTIGEIEGITPPTRSREMIDALDTASTIEEFIAATPTNEGQVTFTQMWESGDTVHEHVDTALTNKTNYEWQIVFPTATPRTATFTAYVESMAPQRVENKTIIKRDVTLRLTSVITWT